MTRVGRGDGLGPEAEKKFASCPVTILILRPMEGSPE